MKQYIIEGPLYEKLQYLNEVTGENYQIYIDDDGNYIMPLDGEGAERIEDDFMSMQIFLVDVLYICDRMYEKQLYG